jgi:hypothetical protein
MSEYLDFLTGEFPADFLQRRFVAAGQDEVAAFGGKDSRDGMADAARCAGNEGDFAC